MTTKKSLFATVAVGAGILGVAGETLADHHSHVLKYAGKEGPGKGRHIVLVAGDEEYRSEEAMPMLGKILSQKHGFDCTVVFPWDAEGKYIDPNNQQGLRGLASLKNADLMLIGTRFRRPSEE